MFCKTEGCENQITPGAQPPLCKTCYYVRRHLETFLSKEGGLKFLKHLLNYKGFILKEKE